MDFFSFRSRACALVRDVVSQKLVFGLSVEDLVVLVLPLFTGVLATHSWVLSSEVPLAHRDEIHIPDADEEVFEFKIFFKCFIHVLVVFLEL